MEINKKYMDQTKVKNFITQSRAKGVSDDEIYSFLESKGAVPPKAKAIAPTIEDVPQEKKTVAGFTENVAKSAGNLVGGIASAVLNPIDTVTNVAKLAKGTVDVARGADTESAKVARSVGNYFKDRYGGFDNIKNTLYNDPVGAAADVAGLVTGGGAALKGAALAGKIGEVADVAGVANKVRQASDLAKVTRTGQAGQTLVNAGNFIDPLNLGKVGFTKTREALRGVKPAEVATDVAPKTTIDTVGEKMLTENIDNHVQAALRPQTIKDPITGKERIETQAESIARVEPKYDRYSIAEENYKKNIKNDMASDVQAKEMSQGFDKVIAKKNTVGKELGELRDTTNTRINTLDIKSNFEQSLDKAGLKINKKGEVSEKGKFSSSISPEDQSSLSYFTQQLRKLGVNPKPRQLSNFVQQTDTTLNNLRAKIGAGADVSYSEKLIKNAYKQISEKYNDPANPALFDIYKKMKEFENLSNLAEEGYATFGYEKTSGGQFIKSASAAKSAIKSLHSAGKKDFIIKLGDAVGEDYINDALIAAQAMKDAGNFRQASLLEDFALKNVSDAGEKGRITSMTEAAANLGRYGFKKVSEKVVGTATEKTRKYIRGEKAFGSSTEKPKLRGTSKAVDIAKKYAKGISQGSKTQVVNTAANYDENKKPLLRNR